MPRRPACRAGPEAPRRREKAQAFKTLQVKHYDGGPVGPGEIDSILYTFAQFLLFLKKNALGLPGVLFWSVCVQQGSSLHLCPATGLPPQLCLQAVDLSLCNVCLLLCCRKMSSLPFH